VAQPPVTSLLIPAVIGLALLAFLVLFLLLLRRRRQRDPNGNKEG